jgi:hypothetical protein
MTVDYTNVNYIKSRMRAIVISISVTFFSLRLWSRAELHQDIPIS